MLWSQVRDLSLAYLLVGLTYLYVGVLIFAAFPSPPLSKECIEPVRACPGTSVHQKAITLTFAFILFQNFLDNFPSSDILVFVARSFLLFQMTTVYPLLGYLVRVQLMGQIFGDQYPGWALSTWWLYIFSLRGLNHSTCLCKYNYLIFVFFCWISYCYANWLAVIFYSQVFPWMKPIIFVLLTQCFGSLCWWVHCFCGCQGLGLVPYSSMSVLSFTVVSIQYCFNR